MVRLSQSIISVSCGLPDICNVPAAPVLSYEQLNSVLSGGASVTVTGLSFNSVHLTSSAAVATIDCATTSWASSTTLSCLHSFVSLASTDAVLGVTVAAVAGTVQNAFTFDGTCAAFSTLKLSTSTVVSDRMQLLCTCVTGKWLNH